MAGLRQPNGQPARHLRLRIVLFFAAAGLWLSGVTADSGWLTGSAIVVAAAAGLLRFIPERPEPPPEND
jgi:hypothetical protein